MKYITGINKAAWIPAIKKAIENWKEFSESVFCDDPEYKQDALDHVATLEQCLAALESDTLTEKQWDEMFLLVW